MSEEEWMEKINQLERSLLELGTEIFYLRSHISDLNQFQSTYHESMVQLQSLMDDKGMIDREEFSEVMNLENLKSKIESKGDFDAFSEEKIKKFSH